MDWYQRSLWAPGRKHPWVIHSLQLKHEEDMGFSQTDQKSWFSPNVFFCFSCFLFVCFVFLHWQVTQTLKNLLYVRNILIIFKQNPKHLCQITYMYDSICPQVFPLLHKTIVRGNIEVQTQRSPSPSVRTIKCSLSFVCGLDWVLLILEYDKSDEMLILWWHYKDIVTYAMLTLFSSHS